LPDELEKVLPPLLGLKTDVPLRGADEASQTGLQIERARLFRFYEAGLHAYRGDRAQWSRTLRSVIAEDPGNAYYRWVGG
jgi:spermidine synthase